jgi:hypothetical protein
LKLHLANIGPAHVFAIARGIAAVLCEQIGIVQQLVDQYSQAIRIPEVEEQTPIICQ